MANLTVNIFDQSAKVIDGTFVDAWAASRFNTNPSGYQQTPSGAANASGTSTGGAVTLTGLSAQDYWIRVFSSSGTVTWVRALSGQVGGSINVHFW